MLPEARGNCCFGYVNCMARHTLDVLAGFHAQVEHYTLQQLRSDEWPESQRVMTVQQALAAAVPHAEQLIIDVKADAADKVRRMCAATVDSCITLVLSAAINQLHAFPARATKSNRGKALSSAATVVHLMSHAQHWFVEY